MRVGGKVTWYFTFLINATQFSVLSCRSTKNMLIPLVNLQKRNAYILSLRDRRNVLSLRSSLFCYIITDRQSFSLRCLSATLLTLCFLICHMWCEFEEIKLILRYEVEASFAVDFINFCFSIRRLGFNLWKSNRWQLLLR